MDALVIEDLTFDERGLIPAIVQDAVHRAANGIRPYPIDFLRVGAQVNSEGIGGRLPRGAGSV